MVLASVVMVLMLLSGNVGRIEGAILCALLAAYLLYSIRSGSPVADDLPNVTQAALMGRSIILFTAGLGLTLLGAHLLVSGASGYARLYGISEAVIGVTIVAVGTSLPEHVTSLIAARKGQSDLALDNVVGSNIFNILEISGTTALVHPLEVPDVIAGFEQWVMLAATVAVLVLGLVFGRLSRLVGGAFVLAYAAYLLSLLIAL